jgi:hypothetical protein
MEAATSKSGSEGTETPTLPGQTPSPSDGWWVGLERLDPDQIRAAYEAQRVPAENAHDRKVVSLQLFVALALILGGAALATLGILLVKETDATKLTAIISLCTAVIGAGAALLPTGAAAGASARILTRSPASTAPAGTPPVEPRVAQLAKTNGARRARNG